MAKVVEIYNNKKMAPKYISEKKAQKYIDKLIKWGYTRTL
jgi:hypothetical protein